MRNTKKIGDVSEAKILATLLAKGFVVLTPFGDNQRYDLVTELDGKFSRIQCKTGKLIKGVIKAHFTSVSSNGQNVRTYAGQVEYFAVYCPQNDKSYLVPSSDVHTSIALRIEPTQKGADQARIRWAKDFEL